MSERDDPRPRLLLVDDNRDNTEILSIFLASRGYVSEAAYDGMSGVRAAGEKTFAAVLLDVLMPGMDGFSAATEIRAQGNSVPIVFVTARGELEAKIEMLRVGGDGYVIKPIDLRELIITLQKVLGRSAEGRYVRRLEMLGQLQMALLAWREDNAREQGERIKQLEQLLAAGAAEHAGESIVQTVVGSAAHALKGELTNLGTGLRVLEESDPPVGLSRHLSSLSRSVAFSRLLVEDLVSLVGLGREGTTMRVEDAVDSAVELMTPRLPVGVRIIKEPVPPDLVASGTFEQLTSALVELIKNAGMAIPAGEPGRIRISVRHSEEDVEIEIADDGPGIPPELAPRLGQTPVPSRTGHGIGLYLISRVLRSYGGHLTIGESSSGATILISVPVPSKRRIHEARPSARRH